MAHTLLAQRGEGVACTLPVAVAEGGAGGEEGTEVRDKETPVPGCKPEAEPIGDEELVSTRL